MAYKIQSSRFTLILEDGGRITYNPGFDPNVEAINVSELTEENIKFIIAALESYGGLNDEYSDGHIWCFENSDGITYSTTFYATEILEAIKK